MISVFRAAAACGLAVLLLSGAPGLPAQAPAVPPPPTLPAGPPESAPAIPTAQDPSRLAKVSPLGQAPDWKTLEECRLAMTRQEFEQAWTALYSTARGLPPPFEITPDALVVPTGNPDKPSVRVEFRPGGAEGPRPPRYWRRAAELPPLKGRPVLSDLHIALDPGHIGGEWARMEERFLSFRPGESIQEGDLSLLTAMVLKDRLTALGALVSLVRDRPEPVTEQRPDDFKGEALKYLKEGGIPDPKSTYEPGAPDAEKSITVQWQAEKLFYRVSEIHARGRKVNRQIKPDLVLCLHFNAESWGAATAPQFSPVNHLHILVNGCYAPVELEQQDVRYEMLRRLFGRVHEEEIPLASAVAEAMGATTRLPAYVYSTPNARQAGTNPYVYARNLLANRLYQCPVVYLEPYVMNHEETFRRLLAGHYVGRTLIGGRLATSAIEDYVKGIVQGLTAYYRSSRTS